MSFGQPFLIAYFVEGGGGRIRTFHALFLSPSRYIDITIQLQLYIKEKKRRKSYHDPCMKLLEAIQHLWLGANNYNSTFLLLLLLFFAATYVRGLDTDKLPLFNFSLQKLSLTCQTTVIFHWHFFEIYTSRISASRWSTATTKVQALKTLNRLTGLDIAFILEVQILSYFFISSFSSFFLMFPLFHCFLWNSAKPHAYVNHLL